MQLAMLSALALALASVRSASALAPNSKVPASVCDESNVAACSFGVFTQGSCQSNKCHAVTSSMCVQAITDVFGKPVAIHSTKDGKDTCATGCYAGEGHGHACLETAEDTCSPGRPCICACDRSAPRAAPPARVWGTASKIGSSTAVAILQRPTGRKRRQVADCTASSPAAEAANIQCIETAALVQQIPTYCDFSFPAAGVNAAQRIGSVCPYTCAECLATAEPTPSPTNRPSMAPSPRPTQHPTADPTPSPTGSPTADPTGSPTADPTAAPTANPTPSPTADPTAAPTAAPTSACRNTDNGATNNGGDGCPVYSANPSYCADAAFLDDADFSSAIMCCECGGGTTGRDSTRPTNSPTETPSEAPTPSPTVFDPNTPTPETSAQILYGNGGHDYGNNGGHANPNPNVYNTVARKIRDWCENDCSGAGACSGIVKNELPARWLRRQC